MYFVANLVELADDFVGSFDRIEPACPGLLAFVGGGADSQRSPLEDWYGECRNYILQLAVAVVELGHLVVDYRNRSSVASRAFEFESFDVL